MTQLHLRDRRFRLAHVTEARGQRGAGAVRRLEHRGLRGGRRLPGAERLPRLRGGGRGAGGRDGTDAGGGAEGREPQSKPG